MKKRNFIIIIAILAVLLAGLIVLVVLNKDKAEEEKISEELRIARKTFDIRLNNEKTEYYIYDLEPSANYDGATITIPDTIDNLPVSRLYDKTGNNFSRYNLVKVIVLGKNIKYIGSETGDDGKILGDDFFTGASQLVAIKVKSGNEYLTSVDGVLYNKNQTVLLKYPRAKTAINEGGVHSYKLPDSVIEIYSKAFYLNSSLQIFNCNNQLKTIGELAFSGCSKLSRITLNEGLEVIGNNAFERCIGISEIILPSTLNKISHGAFIKCVNLARVTFNSVPTLQPNIFTGSFKFSIYISSELYDEFVEELKRIKEVGLIEKIHKTGE